jgi:hypothetical protein
MTASITPADREAARPSAHHLIARGGGCFVIHGKHSDHCDAGTNVIAQAIADARERGRNYELDQLLHFLGQTTLPYTVAQLIDLIERRRAR